MLCSYVCNILTVRGVYITYLILPLSLFCLATIVIHLPGTSAQAILEPLVLLFWIWILDRLRFLCNQHRKLMEF